MRKVLHDATSDNVEASSQDGYVGDQNRHERIEVTATPLDVRLAPGLFLVSFRGVPESPLPPAESGNGDGDTHELQRDLRRVKEELQSTIEELQTSNEEMKASSEEVMSINEELQSTNEELETSKEELQSMNEELRTVNAQLQAKMEEQEATSNDLSSLLSSTDIAVLFLDMNFRIRRFTYFSLTRLEICLPPVLRVRLEHRCQFWVPCIGDSRASPKEFEGAHCPGRTRFGLIRRGRCHRGCLALAPFAPGVLVRHALDRSA